MAMTDLLVPYHQEEHLPQLTGLRPIAEERAVLVDGRDLDPPERDYLAATAIRQSTVAELDANALPAGPLLLHIDLDVVEPADLEGLRFPVPGGPSAESVVAAVRRVLATGRVEVLDIACTWDPATPDPSGGREALLSALLESRPTP